MTLPPPSHPQPSSSRPAGDEVIDERCHAYLLGELTEADSRQFEIDLANPKIARALERESNLLIDLVDQAEAFSSSSETSVNVSLSSRPECAPNPSRLLWSILAIAAALMMAVIYSRQNINLNVDRESPPPFEMAVAESWLEPAIEWDTPDYDWSQDFAFDEGVAEGGSIDDSIAWMVAAVEVAQQAPEQNDG